MGDCLEALYLMVEEAGAADKRWEQAADALFLAKPWKRTTAVAETTDDESEPPF